MSDSERARTGDQVWKVGALAALTGLTVRALHHYDHNYWPNKQKNPDQSRGNL